MTSNPYAWLAICGVVAITLAYKGYIKMPDFGRPTPPQAQYPPASDAHPELDALDSYSLGLAFAKAKRREAEAELAHRIALDAGEQIKATFTAPFSPPAPAGQDPNQAGVRP